MTGHRDSGKAIDVIYMSHSKFLILSHMTVSSKHSNGGFPGGTVVENLPANAGDTGSSPGLGRSHMPWSN